MTKYGLAHEVHEHPVPIPDEIVCNGVGKRPCGRAAHVCCFHCEIFYRCQELKCREAWFSLLNQPKPVPFHCRNSRTSSELAWELLFQHGSDNY